MSDLYGLLIRVLITVWCYFVFILGCIVWGGLGIPLTIVLSSLLAGRPRPLQ